MTIRVTNIQRFCLQDGPGIRTTVFLKGCSIHCPWCANPENLQHGMQEYKTENKRGIYGKDYDVESLKKELLKDRKYWKNGGGITFSGGEALLWIQEIEPLLKELKSEGIHLAVESSLFVPFENLQKSLEYFDFYYVDVKILQESECRKILGGNTAIYAKNAEELYRIKKDMIFRIPCCEKYTLTEDNKNLIKKMLLKYADIPVELFALHRLGEMKYESLGRQLPEYDVMEEKAVAAFQEELVQKGIKCSVIKI